MQNKYLLTKNTKRIKKRILFALTCSLVAMQMVFSSQVIASPVSAANQINKSTYTPLRAVNVPVTGVTMDKSTLTLTMSKLTGTTLKAKISPSNASDKTLYWDSSAPDVATVDPETGKVTAEKAGTTTITVFTEDGNFTDTCEVTVNPDPDLLTFNDPNLDAAVRSAIGETSGDIKKSDSEVTRLASIDLSGLNITDLTGMEKMTHLKAINLSSNQITDLTPLTKLTQLKTLNLSGNTITDLTPLAKLTNLTTLNIGDNQITDITALEKLTKLTSLTLNNNQIEDIMPLKKMTKVTVLNLEQNNIANLNPLKALSKDKLKYVYLTGNPLDDIDITSLRNAIKGIRIYF